MPETSRPRPGGHSQNAGLPPSADVEDGRAASKTPGGAKPAKASGAARAKPAKTNGKHFSVQAQVPLAASSEAAQFSQRELAAVSKAINDRLGDKFFDYDAYGFNLQESCVLNILFDLMQEYQDTRYLSLLPVLLLKNAFGLAAEFYCRTGEDEFSLRTPAILDDGWTAPKIDRLTEDHLISGRRVCVPVRGRFISSVQEENDRKIRGLLVLYPEAPLSSHQLLYLAKFANRLGFAMHNQSLAQRNLEHLDFVRNLVKDIGHNVLGPNMYFKLLISKLGAGLLDLGRELHNNKTDIYSILESVREAHLGLLDQINEIQQNFSHSSLFLESLLRESHFAQGRYVLRTSRLHIFKRVVKAQFDSYLPLFQAKGIEAALELDPDCCDEVEADFGLISQVVANMFSNALKYTTATPEAPALFTRCRVLRASPPTLEAGSRNLPVSNEKESARSSAVQTALPGLTTGLAKGRGMAAKARPAGASAQAGADGGPGQANASADWVRIEVLTSGERIRQEEAEHLFEKYFRASNTGEISGTGKGLHFVSEIVALHKGVTGYEATPEGNLFYFTLPCAPEKKDW